MGGSSSKNNLNKQEVSKFWKLNRKILGKGSFAEVRSATKVDEADELRVLFPHEVAAKIIDKSKLSQLDLPNLMDEVDVMGKIKHKGCVKLYEIFQSESHLVLMLELCRGGELFERIVKREAYGEEEASDIMKQAAVSLKYLHEHNIIHRDLKPENLIFEAADNNVLKVTDFGLAKYIDPDETRKQAESCCGSPTYVAPEVISETPLYTFACDIWSLGVIMYIMLCGFPPFYAEEDNYTALFKQIKKGEFDFPEPFWDDVSDSAKNLVCKMLTLNPKERITAEEILQHPWINGESDGLLTGPSQKSLGLHIQDGIKNILAQTRWKKAQGRLKAVRALGRFPVSAAKK